MSYVFAVSDGTSAQSEATAVDIYAIDAVSSASVSGGTTSGSGNAAEGGSTTMSADLLFDADLLTNALVLTELGVENESAQAIADRWKYDMSGWDAVIGEDGTTFYSFAEYRDAVEKAKTQEFCYLSFADYISGGEAVETKNRPYAVKYVLEDNRLGATIMNGAYLGKTAPKLILVDESGNMINEVLEDQDVRIRCEDAAYLQSIAENGKLYINGSYEAVNKEAYTIDDEILVLDKSLFRVDQENSVTIKADGYQDKKFSISIAKDLKDVTLEVVEVQKTGQEVTITNTADETGDLWKQIQSIKLTMPDETTRSLLPEEQESISSKVGYTVDGAKLILGKDLFKQVGEYCVEISAKYYGVEKVTFTVTETEENGGNTEEELDPPAKVPDGQKTWSNDYQLTFGMGYDAWIGQITGVQVNGIDYENGFVNGNVKYSISKTDGIVKLGSSAFTEECNTITISANGYSDLTLYMDQNGTVTTDPSENGNGSSGEDKEEETKVPPTVSGAYKFYDSYTLTFSGNECENWMKAITSVEVNDSEFEQAEYSYDMNQKYRLVPTDATIYVSTALHDNDENTIVIEADGYETLTIQLDGKGKLIKEAEAADTENEEDEEIISMS